MNKSFLFVDRHAICDRFGKERAKVVTKVLRTLVKRIEKKLNPRGRELLTFEVGVDGQFTTCRVHLCTLEGSHAAFTTVPRYRFAVIWISVFRDSGWSLGLGECGATIESITSDMHKAFRVNHRSVEDADYI